MTPWVYFNMEKLTPIQFAETIKQKYPEYADVDNIELTNRIIEKYPQYWEETVELAKEYTIYDMEQAYKEGHKRTPDQVKWFTFKDWIKEYSWPAVFPDQVVSQNI